MKIEKMEKKMEREGSRALGGRLEWEFLRSFFFFLFPSRPPETLLEQPTGRSVSALEAKGLPKPRDCHSRPRDCTNGGLRS